MPTGLTTSQVQERIDSGNVNKIEHNTRSVREIIITNIFNIYHIFFLAVIALLFLFYLITRDIRLIYDSFGIVSLLIVNTVIAIFQEIRAKQMLDKVNLLIKKTVHVIREGQKLEISTAELVKDDVVYVERGDQIPADGNILQSTRLEVDESLLTGESEPVIKEKDHEILSGSFIVSGTGYFVVTKLGHDSYAGNVTKLAKDFKYLITPLQRKISKIIQILLVITLLVIIFKAIRNIDTGVFTVTAVREYTTVIVSLIPQGLIFLSTITYSLGVYRISRLGAIVQKINAIEALAGVNIVCMDKTGTITQNKLSVTEITSVSDYNTDEIKNFLAAYAQNSSYKNSTINALNIYQTNDNVEVIDELPFSSLTKRSVLKIKLNKQEKVFLLGAYEILKDSADFTNHKLDLVNYEQIKHYRNLLFAEVHIKGKINTENILNHKITPICIVSVVDTIRDDAEDVLKLFKNKNISIKILSGDSPTAVQAITDKIGWQIDEKDLISGSDLAKLKDDEFTNTVLKKKIFARLAPDQKQMIIKALQDRKYYTAMIGDGVNDLPAIKTANLGIAMEEGSQITKSIADIILVKNKFTLMPDIFDEGNRIINSINMAAKLFLTKNFTVGVISLLSIIFIAFPFVLTPRRVGFITIFIITLPSFLISVYNKNTEKKTNFIKDLLFSAGITATCLLIFGYLGYILAPHFFPEISTATHDMVLMNIMIIITITSFLSITLPSHTDKYSKLIFIFYSVVLISLLLVATLIDLMQTWFFWFAQLYEISYVAPKYWILISIIAGSGSIILYFLQILKRKYLQ